MGGTTPEAARASVIMGLIFALSLSLAMYAKGINSAFFWPVFIIGGVVCICCLLWWMWWTSKSVKEPKVGDEKGTAEGDNKIVNEQTQCSIQIAGVEIPLRYSIERLSEEERVKVAFFLESTTDSKSNGCYEQETGESNG